MLDNNNYENFNMSPGNDENGKGKENKRKLGGAAKFSILVLSAVLCGLLLMSGYQLTRYITEDLGKHDNVIGAPVKDDRGGSEAEESADYVADDKADEKSEEDRANAQPVSTGDVSAVVENALPSVVSIDCKVIYSQQNFWGMPQSYETSSSGSGFIIGQNGRELLIATNNHVIEGASDVTVTFCDESSASAVVKGADGYYDLAVISVDISELEQETIDSVRIATLGDSSNLAVGSMAIAIGNALGYGQSTTVGYISALDRTVESNGTSMALIQTDAAINPGNSGGPLLNVHGAVIGINSVKYASEEIEGMGYAIPITKAIPIINELINRVELNEYERGYLGIKGKDIGSSYSQAFNMPAGVYVYSVDEGSAAEKAGLLAGDIITAINDREVSSMAEIQTVLSYMRAGTAIELHVKTLVNGEYTDRVISVTLQSW